jgi:predicted TIM-barrel fold metal-dependent hydrolase
MCATFVRDDNGVRNRNEVGVDNMMWSTDYPHHRHDWPYSRRVIEESMGGVPEDEKHAMTCGNAIALYGLGD